MILAILALQAAAAPDLSGAAWQYLGRSERVAHYADANSVRREGDWASVVYRMVYIDPAGQDKVGAMRIECVERYGIGGQQFAVEASGIRPIPSTPFDSVRLPAQFYRPIAVAANLACDGRPALPVSDPVADARTQVGRRPIEAR